MAPIPVYSSSPINAAKPGGVTPKTAGSGNSNDDGHAQPEPTQTSGEQPYLRAQPGAKPALPRETGAPQAWGHVQTTPTRTSAVGDVPPPPQPGAVPVPPGGGVGSGGGIPPPPRAGQPVPNFQSPPVTTMPPQMRYQAPQAPLHGQARSSTATTGGPQPHSVTGAPTLLQGNYPTAAAGFSPPAGGYQQDANAAGYNSYQTSAAAYDDGTEASVWDTAKKWATSAGESIAAAESEVWKRINKG